MPLCTVASTRPACLNAIIPIVVTDDGMVIELSDEQFSKQDAPIVVIPFAKVTSLRYELFIKSSSKTVRFE